MDQSHIVLSQITIEGFQSQPETINQAHQAHSYPLILLFNFYVIYLLQLWGGSERDRLGRILEKG